MVTSMRRLNWLKASIIRWLKKPVAETVVTSRQDIQVLVLTQRLLTIQTAQQVCFKKFLFINKISSTGLELWNLWKILFPTKCESWISSYHIFSFLRKNFPRLFNSYNRRYNHYYHSWCWETVIVRSPIFHSRIGLTSLIVFLYTETTVK